MLRSFWHFCLTVEQVMNPLQERPVAWVIGGTSGLGLELAIRLSVTHDVLVTGRSDHVPQDLPEFLYYSPLDLTPEPDLLEGAVNIRKFVSGRARVDTLVYAAGVYAEDPIGRGTVGDVARIALEQATLSLVAPRLLVEHIVRNQGDLPAFIVITSTSQHTARSLEPSYAAGKAAEGMLAESISLDPEGRIGKTLVVAPGGMDTKFWRKRPDRMTGEMLDAGWVGDQGLDHLASMHSFKSLLVPRDPPRVEVLKER